MRRSASVLELYLIRHGESEGNAAQVLQGQSEHALTPRGREEADQLAVALAHRGVRPVGVYSSDQSRARDTARIIAEVLDVPGPVELIDLREIQLGPITGLTRAEASRLHPEVMERFERGISLGEMLPGAESWADVQRRAGRALRGIRRRHAHGPVLIVSHGALLVNMFKALLKVPARHKLIVPIRNASYVRVVLDGELVWLDELFQANHLAD